MKRLAMKQLLEWKESKNRKPLIIRGARQVGKTWLMKEFGNSCFDNLAYINFENNERMHTLFEGNYDINRLIEGLQIESGERINPKTTLLVLDEIQEEPKALTSLKYFFENSPEYAILAAGSSLGVALHEGTSFPVGKVDFMNLYPMTYGEFLQALGEDDLLDLLRKARWDLIEVFASRYIDLLRKYYFVGGMPEAVFEYVQNFDYSEVRKIQKQILFTYDQDFSKHVPAKEVPRVRAVWNNVLVQLAKENKKFSPGVVEKNSRLKDYELALQWLQDCSLLHRVGQISKPHLPLAVYETGHFKLYLHDVGLLAAMADLDKETLLEGSRIFTEYKGALTEQYVAQELIAKGLTPYYWSSTGKAEVDFVLKIKTNVYPLEVKAEENLQSKSLKVYTEKHKPSLALRTSMRDYRKEIWMMNIPLYAISSDFLD